MKSHFKLSNVRMKKESNSISSMKNLSNRLFYYGFGILMLLISVLLTYGAFFEKQKAEDFIKSDILSTVLILIVVWSFTLYCLTTCSNRVWIKRIGERSGTLGSVTLIVFLISLGIREIVIKKHQAFLSSNGGVTLWITLVFIILVGLVLYFSERKSFKRSKEKKYLSSPWLIIAWPLMFIGRSPTIGLLVFLFLIGIIYVGERIGQIYSQPLIGAFCGLGIYIIIWGLFMFLVREKGDKAE